MDDASPALVSSSGCLLTGVIHAASPIFLEFVQKNEPHPASGVRFKLLHTRAMGQAWLGQAQPLLTHAG